MELIDKEKVVEEIRRIMAEEMSFFKDCSEDELEVASSPVVYTRMEMLLSFLNTLEVKEVDLEKEIDKELENTWYGEYLNIDKFKESAKHFFELGLKTKDE